MFEKRTILVLLAVGVLAGLVWTVEHIRSSPAPIGVDLVPTEMRTIVERNITNFGIDASYARFKADFAHEPPNQQHAAAHVFGEALYKIAGTAGFAWCDPTFNFGCYHGFAGKAIAQEGLHIVSELDAVCQTRERSSACQHGLGHGILEYFGSTQLVQALEACSLTHQPDPQAGCTSGVFMEYNGPFVISENKFVPREFDGAHPTSPCPELPEKFQLSCFRQLPQWWKISSDMNFEGMGNLCTSVGAQKNRDACFSGMGAIAGSIAQYVPDATVALCRDIHDPSGEVRCIVEASWAFVLNINDSVGGVSVCKEAPVTHKKFCPQPL